MQPTRIPLVFLFVLAGCVQVTKEMCFEGEPCADAGRDAGRDAGPGGGAGGGGDAGGMGGGGGGSGGDGGASDGGPNPGFCLDWPCVTSALGVIPVQPSPTDFTLIRLAIPPVVSFNCAEHWRGGVLLPDGKVLAVPYCADRMLLIDPMAKTVAAVGPVLPAPPPRPDGGQPGRYAGGVLACDRGAYLLPFGGSAFGRVAMDGSFSVTDLNLVPNSYPFEAQGGVVDRDCRIWITTRNPMGEETSGRLTFLPNGAMYSFPPRPSMSERNGMVRVGDTALIPVASAGGTASVFVLDLVSTLYSQPIVPTPTGTSFRSGAIGASGVAHFFDVLTGSPLRVGPNGIQLRSSFYGTGFGYPAYRGDGFIYVLGDRLLAMADTPDGGVFTQLASELQDAGGAPGSFAGLVATPTGVLVAIPSEYPGVLLMIPNTGINAPPEVLLSPFFNKL